MTQPKAVLLDRSGLTHPVPTHDLTPHIAHYQR